jgi:mannose-6-phosphate isomerase-like protein (cupin superfamily)
MKRQIIFPLLLVLVFALVVSGQTRQPSQASRPFVIKTKQQVSDITKALVAKPGNTNEDIVAAAGMQTRIAIFHDEKRENDLNEVHDGSDDIYYVTNGTATLMLGGTLVEPNEISPGEWRAKTATGGEKVTIKKGDLVFVPRGTRHQRTVTDKKFTMILIKIFSANQPK